jgi:hypothetical protein
MGNKTRKKSGIKYPDLDMAVGELRCFAPLPFQDASVLTPQQDCEREGQAERLVVLAASFAGALADAGGGPELQRRGLLLRNLAERGSPYDGACRESYEKLWYVFWGKHKTVVIDGVSMTMTSMEHHKHLPAKWKDVERFLGSMSDDEVWRPSDTILWCPYETKGFCDRLLASLDFPELVRLGHELRKLFERMETDRLWGSFLITESREFALASTSDPPRYHRLQGTILRSQGAVEAIKKAADDLVVAMRVDPAKLDEDLQNILVAMLELGATNESKRRTTNEIAERALGNSELGETLKPKMPKLKGRGFVSSKPYRGGGCWLTSAGKAAAEKLSKR